ncbi:penicillin-binding protein [Xylanimonas allomyrinae]|uniref:Penicillin-binding protein n=1 Tax=Xylanimonas allomyrinae TaxID=2509459 RepID=A0A4P6ETK6_9MICO|nr:transglycosylase domain-containing protein [Xylanimonas allomyrinae]QAY63707.1 penicillin-binding protein [Xylanimonas allomyrinae]
MARRRAVTPHEPRRITRTIPATQLVALLLAFVLVAGAGGIIAAGLAIPVAAGASSTTNASIAIFDEVPDELKPGPLSQASTVFAANGEPLATFYAQNRVVVPLDEVSDAMKHAVVAIEDERFYDHGGVDPQGIARAAVNNLMKRPKQGASTLTQQYVKNVLIDQAEQSGDAFGVFEAAEDSNARKVKEMKYAIALEKTMTKDQILEGYLNVAQFGKNSIYGVETAARYFFNKPAKDLTVVEAATIAGITKAPSTFDPTVDPQEAQNRRHVVLHKMYTLGYISTLEEYRAADATPIEDTLHITPVPTGCQAAGGAAFFCAYVISEITNNPVFGETKDDRKALLYRGGLSITTTLDLSKQSAAEQQVSAHVPNGNTAGLESAVVSVEPGTGKILAMAQNVPFDASKPPKPGTTAVNYSADPAHGASKGFQPGSNFKPFVLAEWLKSGHTLNDVVSATKTKRLQSAWHASCRGPFSSRPKDAWGPANSEGNISGDISVLKATYNSVNTAFASMGTQLDLCSLADTAWSMGFRPTTKEGGETLHNPTRDDIYITPSMLIGTQTTSPLQLAAAFGTLASNGTYCSPIAITAVTTPDGEQLPVPSADCNANALPANVAATVVSAMENVLTQGTARGNSLAGGRAAAGKTGTNQFSAQTWFTGFTPQLVTTVWVGEASGEVSHLNINFNGTRIAPLYGSTLAAPLWKDYMNQALDGAPLVDFPAPDPALVGSAPKPSAPPTQPTDENGVPVGPDGGQLPEVTIPAGDDHGNAGGHGGGH